MFHVEQFVMANTARDEALQKIQGKCERLPAPSSGRSQEIAAESFGGKRISALGDGADCCQAT